MKQSIKCPLCNSTEIEFLQTADIPLQLVGNELIPISDTGNFDWHGDIQMFCVSCGASSDSNAKLLAFVREQF